MPINRYLTLVFYLTYAELKSESKKFFVSYLWWIVEPVVNMAVYYVVFGVLLNRGTDNYIAFLLIGLIPWRWFSAAVMQSSMIIGQQKQLIKRVVVPKTIFPTVNVLTHTFKFVIVFAVLVLFLMILGMNPSIHYLALIPLLISQFFFILGVSYVLCSFVPFMMDLKLAINSAIMMLFFLSGIFFSGENLTGNARTLFYLNPLAHMIEAYRDILLKQHWPSSLGIFILFSLGVVAMFLGRFLLHKWSHMYPKVLR